MSNIHPTAVIDPSAKLDASVKVGPYAVIGPKVEVGAGSVIGAHAVLECVRMGKDNHIFSGSFVGTAPQDLKYAGEETMLLMGDKNKVRECVTLNRGTTASGETRIGSGCLFMAYSHVAHDCRVGDGVITANSVALAGHVTVGDYSVLGGLVGIHQFVRIGRFCMVGGGAMVNKDIPSFCTAQGDRATLRGLNLLGMRRAGLSHTTVKSVKDAYKTLFLSGLTQEESFAQLNGRQQPPEVLEILGFIEGSKRGVTRPAAGAVEEEAAL